VSDDLPVHIRPLAGDLRRRAVTLPRSTGNPARPPAGKQSGSLPVIAEILRPVGTSPASLTG
jgi:hypothetical protein